jgi:DNA-binding NarL/FixJ family response regulator
MKRPRVVLADDHTLMLDALKNLLEPEFDVVGLFADGHELMEGALDNESRSRHGWRSFPPRRLGIRT